MNTNKENLENLITDNPKLHDWGRGLVSGGLGPPILSKITTYLLEEFGESNFCSLETGAGLSTLVFAAAIPKRHIAINPDHELKKRIFDEAERRSISLENVEYITEFSEDVLPDLAKREAVDLALIDGGHGWPTVFVDFCYANMMLRKGGIMIVDDITLYPCTALYMLLKHQPGWVLEEIIYLKTAFFRKETAAVRLPDFGGQPYLTNNLIQHRT